MAQTLLSKLVKLTCTFSIIAVFYKLYFLKRFKDSLILKAHVSHTYRILLGKIIRYY